MKDELARILGLLEDGKIDAAEAERLIRAISDSGHARRCDFREQGQRARDDLRAAIREIAETLRQADRKRRRYIVWRSHLRRRACSSRREARREEPALDRLRAVLRENAVCDTVAEPSARLADMLNGDPFGWSNLRFGLELEFGRAFTQSELEACETVAALASMITGETEDQGAKPATEKRRPKSRTPASEPA
jgi:hypothetical protein